MQDAVTYIRVSSKEQEETGYSPEAQKKLLWAFSRQNDLEVVQDFEDVETAKRSGRNAFNAMIEYVSKNGIKHILVEKTDRLHRNFKDYALIEDLMDEFDVTVHLVKEGQAMRSDSSSHEKFMHGVKTLMAKNFIDNLSEEVKKGQKEKIEQGIYPARAPLGYSNAPDPLVPKRNIILVDKNNADLIRKIFEYYGNSEDSVDAVTERVISEGFATKLPAGKKLSRTGLYGMLKNPFYIGKFIWNKRIYDNAQHEALVSLEIWLKVQRKLGERACKLKITNTKKEFVFSGIFTCGECGRGVTAELKKGKYVYYRCTKYKRKCTQKSITQTDADDAIYKVLASLGISDTGFKYLKLALKQSLGNKREWQDTIYENLASERMTLKNRIDKMYEDRLDEKISDLRYNELTDKWNGRLEEIDKTMKKHDKADANYYDFGVKILELGRNAENLYKTAKPEQQRRLMQYLLSNSELFNQIPQFSLKLPFARIAKHAPSGTCPSWQGLADDFGTFDWVSLYKELTPFPEFVSLKMGW